MYGCDHLSVAELSKKIKKSIPFTSSLISEMIEDEVLEECGLAKSNGGRRPQLYAIKDNNFYTVGVAVNQIKATLAVFDLNGNQIIGPISRNIRLSKTGEDLVELGEFISESIVESDLDREKILGVGIGMPGFIDSIKGVNHTFLDSGTSSIVSYLEDVLGFSVFIDNDSSLIGLAELKQGCAKGHPNALVVNIGWGIGLGVVIAERVFRGEKGFAGEFSHIPLFDNNKICSCGKLGCLETESSLYVLLDAAREGLTDGAYTSLPDRLPEDPTEAVGLIFEAMKQGDTFSIGLLRQVGQNLGRGISILIHLFNPGLIVLSGMGSSPGRYWLPPVQQAINEHSIGKLAEKIELKISRLGPAAELVGAAALVVDRLEEVQVLERVN